MQVVFYLLSDQPRSKARGHSIDRHLIQRAAIGTKSSPATAWLHQCLSFAESGLVKTVY
jgi:hypothetical protein